MFVALWLGVPAVLGALAALFVRSRSHRWYVLFGAGLLLGAAYVLVAYLTAPHEYQHSQGDEDGKMFLGRWWEPGWVAFVVFVGYVCWSLGILAGLLVRAAAGAGRRRAWRETA